MFLAVHLLASAMYAVLLAPLGLFLGLKVAIWRAHRRGGPTGWLADAERILHADGGSGVPDRPQGPRRGPAPVRVQA